MSSLPEPTSSEVEVEARTVSLVKLSAASVDGLAGDGSNLYLTSLALGFPGSYELQRCIKSDCWHSLASIRRVGWPMSGVELHSGRLGWVSLDGFELCDSPDCQHWQLVKGAIFGDSSPRITWDQAHAYWFLDRDSAIYRCGLPNCDAGPELVASHTFSLNAVTLLGEEVYWLDEEQGILRTASDGTRPPERLTLDAQTTWAAWNYDVPVASDFIVRAMALDGPWIYAVLAAGVEEAANGNRLARWRHAETGAVREWVVVDDPRFDDLAFMRVFDGEVVWGTRSGNLSSCLADHCAASLRQFGVEGNVAEGRSIVADQQYIFWLSAPCDSQKMHCGDVWNLKRTPRIAR